jgi:formylglycine-generating enzyme required for sulfatase activity
LYFSRILEVMMRVVSAIVLAVCSLWLTCQPAFAQKRIALVIGNSFYERAPRLSNPVNDANSMAEMFKSAGFDTVELKLDVKAAEMRRALRDFSDDARGADIAIIYFAGHGLEIQGTNYLVPTDAVLERDIDAYDEAVSLERLLNVIEPARQLRLVILDACRDNPFIKSMKHAIVSRSYDRGLAKVEPVGPNTLVAFAAKAGSTADDGNMAHSPFTAALVKFLPQPGLDLRRAFGYVRDDVLKATRNRQEPFIYGSLGGDDFPLVGAPAVAPPPPPPPAPVDANKGAREDYELTLQINVASAWDAFIRKYPTGFYSELAILRRDELRARQTATDQARVAAEKKAADEAKAAEVKAAEAKAAEAERQRLAAQAKAEQEAKLAAEKARAELAAWAEAEKKAAEVARLAAEKSAAEDARLLAEKKAAEAKAVEEAQRLAAEKKAAEEARIAAERKAAEDARAAEAKAAEARAAEAARAAAEKKAAEEARLAAERKAAEARAAEAKAAQARAAEAKMAEARAAEAKAAEAKAAEAKAAEAARVKAAQATTQMAAILPGDGRLGQQAAPTGCAGSPPLQASISADGLGALSLPEECALKPKSSFRECPNCPEMVVIPAGEFLMGSPKAEIDSELADANEAPQHKVAVKQTIAIGRFEVTRDQFAAFVEASGYRGSSRCMTFEQNLPNYRENRSFLMPGYAQDGNHPAVCVSWTDAQAYADWLSKTTGKTYRLPSEAEFEYAARAGGTARYAFTDDPADLCRFANGADQSAKTAGLPPDAPYMECSDGYPFTAPVGSFAANAFGLHDLIGNVWEWTADCFANDYKSAGSDSAPRNEPGCTARTVRGGDWFSTASTLRPAVRAKANQDSHNDDIGFRVVRILAH